MRVFAISDLHGYFPPWIPECELLLLGGDYCPTRDLEQERRFMLGPFTDFLKRVPAKHIVGIAGNHDFILQEDQELARSLPWKYLQDEAIDIEGVKIYGTPWTPQFYNWAFMCNERELADKFNYVPEGLDILLSHGPAYQRLDRNAQGEHCGSMAMLQRVREAKPDSFVCGHIHEGHGIAEYENETRYYNVAYLNGKMEPKYNCINIPLRADDGDK